MEDRVKDEIGEWKYVALSGCEVDGRTEVMSLKSQSAVATIVALNRALALSSLLTQIAPLASISVEMRVEGLLPLAYLLAWKRVSTVSVDRYLLQELRFSLSMACMYLFRA